MKLTTTAVIMAGGVGERFWPFSRKSRPKQLLTLFGKKPMIKETVDRLKPLISMNNVYISTNLMLASEIKKVLPKAKYVLEPVGRNTAACIGLSAMKIMKDLGDSVIFVETSDHVYADTKAYLNHIKAGVKAALANNLVLIGIKPTEPHTGYGYIQAGKVVSSDKIPLQKVSRFREKPDLKTAVKYLKSGNYYWNSGMAICKASVIISEIRKHMPKLYKALDRIMKSDFKQSVMKMEFSKLDSVSIDCGVWEKSSKTTVLGSKLAWDDIGDWNALARHFPLNKEGNVILGNHSGINTKGSIIVSSDKLVATYGVTDLIIIDTKDGLLVMDRKNAPDLKKLVTKLPRKVVD